MMKKVLIFLICILNISLFLTACHSYEGPPINSIEDVSDYLLSIPPSEYGWYYITDYDKPLEDRKDSYTVYILKNDTRQKLEAFAKEANKALGDGTIYLKEGQYSYQELMDAQDVLVEHSDELNWWSVGCDVFNNRVKYSIEMMTESEKNKVAELVPLEMLEIFEHSAPIHNSDN